MLKNLNADEMIEAILEKIGFPATPQYRELLGSKTRPELNSTLAGLESPDTLIAGGMRQGLKKWLEQRATDAVLQSIPAVEPMQTRPRLENKRVFAQKR